MQLLRDILETNTYKWQPGWSFWLRIIMSHLPALSDSCSSDKKSARSVQTFPENFHFPWKIYIAGKVQIYALSRSSSFIPSPQATCTLPIFSSSFLFSIPFSLHPLLPLSFLRNLLCGSQRAHNKDLFFLASSVVEDARNYSTFKIFLGYRVVTQADRF